MSEPEPRGAPNLTRASDAGRAGAKDAATLDAEERRARQALAVAAIVTASGLAVAGTVSRAAGGVMALAGWVVLVGALHAFGRASPRR